MMTSLTTKPIINITTLQPKNLKETYAELLKIKLFLKDLLVT